MDSESGKIRITRAFVECWSARFDYRDDYRDEQRLKRWLAKQSGRKFLDKKRFLSIAMWKTPRAKDHYEANSAGFVRRVTDQAFQTGDDRLRLHILMALDGVGVPVASTLLHFAFPDMYPILDIRALTTLTKAGLWSGNKPGASTPADWLKYTRLMRGLSKKLRVDLRTLDKALWAFDKHGGQVRQGAVS
jgi:thermostable 8-oxoguanine DNA glycosylase